ncbi:hypothetical protein SEA_CHUBSTER_85 [Arthrobacter phage Chubster]|uniref:Uncharacterized protein n=1 Tax=Arthrobacter phage Chubster TaxID=1897527 RepID=A0A1I9SCQ9_9CAUD|nr:hypothetical protein SEA_CHUBSTER_85 [Arthrobacter phage Chubster]
MSLHLVKAIEELAARCESAGLVDAAEVGAELRAILKRYPLPPEDADERDSTHWLFQRHSETLTRVANAVNGPPKPLWSHSHHDLGEKAEELAAKHAAALNPSPALLDAVAESHMLDFNIPGMAFARQEVRSVLKHLGNGLDNGLR